MIYIISKNLSTDSSMVIAQLLSLLRYAVCRQIHERSIDQLVLQNLISNRHFLLLFTCSLLLLVLHLSLYLPLTLSQAISLFLILVRINHTSEHRLHQLEPLDNYTHLHEINIIIISYFYSITVKLSQRIKVSTNHAFTFISIKLFN